LVDQLLDPFLELHSNKYLSIVRVGLKTQSSKR
jgi:hypothetical protein